jgi:hypothetical protein
VADSDGQATLGKERCQRLVGVARRELVAVEEHGHVVASSAGGYAPQE